MLDGWRVTESRRRTHLMIILQELETTDQNPRRLADWAALAKDVGARVAA